MITMPIRPYAAAKPVIDGTVDDAEWQDVRSGGNFLVEWFFERRKLHGGGEPCGRISCGTGAESLMKRYESVQSFPHRVAARSS